MCNCTGHNCNACFNPDQEGFDSTEAIIDMVMNDCDNLSQEYKEICNA